MKRYESYKPSGVKWIGDIPSHWEIRPGFTCFSENKDRNKGLVENTVLSLSYGRIVIKPEEKLTGLVPASFEGYQLISPGDIIIRTMDLQNDFTSLRVGYARDRGMITSAYLGLRCNPEINSKYVFRLLECYDALKIFYGMGSGLRQNMDFGDFKRLPIILPPRDEQDRIVAFLDQKAAETDAAISKKERLIELLREQQSILFDKAISGALNKGLNNDVAKRDSSCESTINSVPVHWPRHRLKYCVDLLPGFAFKSSSYTQDERDIPLLRGININPGQLHWGEIVYWPKDRLRNFSAYMLKEGDLVIGMDRPWVSGGIRVAAIHAGDLPCLLLQRVARLRATHHITQEFLKLALTSRRFLFYFEPMLTGISVPHISPEQIGNFEVNLPQIDEQDAICSYVKEAKARFLDVVRWESQSISSLAELKTILIADVVTGRIKV